jgi:cell division protease FtsH
MDSNDPGPERKDSERKDPPGGSDNGNSSLT